MDTDAGVDPSGESIDAEAGVAHAALGTGLRWRRPPPALLLLLPVAYVAWTTRVDLLIRYRPNDLVVHRAFVAWARLRIAEGRLPFDGWFPYLSGGSPVFHQYQSLGHQVLAFIEYITGTHDTAGFSSWLLLSLWPLCIYLAMRILGTTPWESTLVGIVSVLPVAVPGLGYELRSYLEQGVWSQLLGMWLLPLALAVAFRAVSEGRWYGRSLVLCALCVSVHFPTGFLLLAVLGLMALLRPSDIRRRLPRVVGIGTGSLLMASFAIVPLMEDQRFLGVSEEVKGSYLADSYGGRQVLSWLTRGAIFDAGRAPVLSVLVLVGLAVALLEARHSERHRFILLLGATSMLLFSGRSVIGPVLRWIPGAADLQLNRYLIGVHLAGVLLAASALYTLGALVRPLLETVVRGHWLRVSAVAVMLAGLLVIPVRERAVWLYRRMEGGQEVIQVEGRTAPKVETMIDAAQSAGPGRFYGGSLSNEDLPNTSRLLSQTVIVGISSAYTVFPVIPVDSIGLSTRTVTLVSDVERRFDESNPSDYRLWNVRYLLLPKPLPPQVPTQLVATNDWVALYTVDGVDGNYLSVADTVKPAVSFDRLDIGRRNDGFLASDDISENRRPVVAFDGEPAATPTLKPGADPSGPPGQVRHERQDLEDGLFVGDVTMARRAAVVLSAGYHPRMEAFVDGHNVKTEMVAPGFAAVTVPRGRHRVEFHYRSYQYYWVWGLVALVTLGLAWWASRRAERGREASGAGDPVSDGLGEGDGDEGAGDEGGAEGDVLAAEADEREAHDDSDERRDGDGDQRAEQGDHPPLVAE